MKPACFVLMLFFAALPPLGAQNETGPEDYEDDSFDEWLLMEGEELTISGSVNTTQQMETVSREVIEKIHAKDIPSLLEEALGLGVTRYGPYGNQAGVNLRGFDIKRVAVLIDGIPVNSTASGGFDFYSVDPLSIERIEVIHGGSDTKFNVSGALGGIVNIITVKKPKTGWSLGGGFTNTSFMPGKYNVHGGQIGPPQWQDLADSQNINLFGAYGAENYSYKISFFGNRIGNHFLYRDHLKFIRRKEGSEVLDAGVTASFTRNTGDLSKLIAAGSFYYGDKNIPASGYAVNFTEQRDLASRETIMFDMPRAFHDNFSMEMSLGHNWKKMDSNPSGPPSIHDEHSLTLINRWGWYPAAKFALRFGGDYSFIRLDSKNTGLRYGHRSGLYASSEYSPVKGLLLISSVKGITAGGDIVPVPKLGLSWAVNDNLTLKNNYFRSFKFPDFDDLYWVQAGFAGNPDLKNEDGWGADLIAEFAFKDLQINSAIYGEWTKDSIHWNNSSLSWRPENYGAAAFLGWDNKLKFAMPFSSGPFAKPVLDLSWAFQLSWLLSGDLSFNDNKRIPYMPVHAFGAGLEIPWKSKTGPGSLVISGRFESSRFTDTGNTIELPAHFLLNIIFNQEINNNINVFAKVNNTLNADYVSFAAYPMPGISLSLGMNMIFENLGKQAVVR
ncbi:MAG: TonB-dependent receptor [Treponema sp.]|jgi:vitamin B12 transporter|nr:TonB-dependent receptor [Treponema sp.]